MNKANPLKTILLSISAMIAAYIASDSIFLMIVVGCAFAYILANKFQPSFDSKNWKIIAGGG